VEINTDEPGDNRAMKSIRALDRNLATWIQKLALEPVDINADGLLSENQSTKIDQGMHGKFDTSPLLNSSMISFHTYGQNQQVFAFCFS
jgi:hypothetical protein